ncbi:Domain of unknown function DUF4266 [Sphingomonadaceae bacterium]|jgi:hypothetical protein
MNKVKIGACALCLTVALGGCASVQPWERGITARQSMQLIRHPHIAAAKDHINFSKEASAGGRDFSGGGCGCN